MNGEEKKRGCGMPHHKERSGCAMKKRGDSIGRGGVGVGKAPGKRNCLIPEGANEMTSSGRGKLLDKGKLGGEIEKNRGGDLLRRERFFLDRENSTSL